MPYIQSAKSSLAPPVNIYYEDTLQGKPVIFIHGWPLDSSMWEYQINVLAESGIRCISYDRRGFGNSDKPWNGYDYDTLAADLKSLIDTLDLENVTLVGFSMGGGEVARYIGRYGSSKIERIVLVSAVTPFLLQQADNPDGIPEEQFESFADDIREDRPAFMAKFGKTFYGVGFLSNPVSEEFLDLNQSVVLKGSARATLECLYSFSHTDFRQDLAKINIPTLIIHGDSDKTVPFDISAKKAVKMIPQAEIKIYEGEPHGIFYTQKDLLNQNLLDFILGPSNTRPVEEMAQLDPSKPLRHPNASI